MKKLSIALILVLALTLTACGGPTAAPSPTPEATPEVLESAQPTGESVEYPLLVKAGESVSVDLDGDGVNEDVCLTPYGEDVDYGYLASLAIAGQEYNNKLYDLGYNAYNSDPDYYAIVDLDTTDKYLEIAVQDWGPSDDYTTALLRWRDGELTYLGSVSGMIYHSYSQSGDITFNGDGTLTSYLRYRVLMTWFAECEYGIIPGGDMLSVIPQDLYYPKYEAGLDVTTLMELPLYTSRDAAAEGVIAVGTRLHLTCSDNAEWVGATDENGQEVWIHLDAQYGQDVETSSGYVVSSLVLDGLLFAD